MNRTYLLSTIGVLLFAAACSHPRPVAATPPAPPPPPPPQEQAKPPAPQAQAPKPVQAAKAKPAPQPQQAKTITPAERARLRDSLNRLEDALFDYDQSAIRPDAATALQKDVTVVKDILANYPQEKLKVEGNCDQRGSQEYNLMLGDRRAHAAMEFLQSMGISASQLTVVSYGKDRPQCTEDTEACYQKNRRAHLTAD